MTGFEIICFVSVPFGVCWLSLAWCGVLSQMWSPPPSWSPISFVKCHLVHESSHFHGVSSYLRWPSPPCSPVCEVPFMEVLRTGEVIALHCSMELLNDKEHILTCSSKYIWENFYLFLSWQTRMSRNSIKQKWLEIEIKCAIKHSAITILQMYIFQSWAM